MAGEIYVHRCLRCGGYEDAESTCACTDEAGHREVTRIRVVPAPTEPWKYEYRHGCTCKYRDGRWYLSPECRYHESAANRPQDHSIPWNCPTYWDGCNCRAALIGYRAKLEARGERASSFVRGDACPTCHQPVDLHQLDAIEQIFHPGEDPLKERIAMARDDVMSYFEGHSKPVRAQEIFVDTDLAIGAMALLELVGEGVVDVDSRHMVSLREKPL